ncbi:MAG TPA: hypothetical protein DCK95_10775 [Anaerolineaceae bacterium]|uniref:Type III restriction protein res subunit n=1 Tax=Anaerolinea thermophila TaxID=167964 RepID=A0A117LH86_9CHLR|nr:MAG: Type III restriction protein res subunit [Anaerolinea thermophila]HAF62791.1 hypothetical protein [Anaerolineaceae bacterium]
MPSEIKTKIKINEKMKNVGWRFFTDENGPANIVLENHTNFTKRTLDEKDEALNSPSTTTRTFYCWNPRKMPTCDVLPERKNTLRRIA